MWVRGCPRGRGQLCACARVPRLGARVFWWCSPSSLRASVSSTPPPPHPPPSSHPSIRQSVYLSRIRPSIPVRSIIFPIPKEGAKNQLSFSWAAGTQSSPDGGSQRFTHLPADTARLGRKGALSHPPGLLPPSEGPSRSLLPPRSPESFLWAESWIPRSPDYFALLLGRPSRPFCTKRRDFPPLAFSFGRKTWET